MSKYVKIAATYRTCAAVDRCLGIKSAERAATACIGAVLEILAPEKTDLAVFPEMCDMPAGWSMKDYVSYIAERDEAVPDFVREKARALGMWIAYPTVRRDQAGVFYNSCLLIDRKGDVAACYDKLYPTQGELEAGIQAGEKPVVFECELGRVGFVICFDLNYQQLAQAYRKERTDLLLFPSLFDGGLLRQSWALAAGSYLVGACGGCGASVVAPTGEVLQKSTGDSFEMVTAVNLDSALVHLDFHQEKLMRISQKYGSAIHIHSPEGLGRVLLESTDPSVAIRDVLREFDMETLEEYLQRLEQKKNKLVLDGGTK